MKQSNKRRCEKQESNLRTPARTDLESASVDHLDILAQNTICFRIVKAFDNPGIHSRILVCIPSQPLVSTQISSRGILCFRKCKTLSFSPSPLLPDTVSESGICQH